MGATFSAPDGLDWSSLANFYLTELANACSERLNFMSLGGDAISVGSLLADVSTADWETDISPYRLGGLQTAFSAISASIWPDTETDSWPPFLDHNQTLEGSNRIRFLRWTPTTFCAEVGLPVYTFAGGALGIGWRRTTVHPSDPAFVDFDHGPMEAGDIIGPWILEDLEKVCCAIRWIEEWEETPYELVQSGTEYEQYGNDTTLAGAITSAEASEATNPISALWTYSDAKLEEDAVGYYSARRQYQHVSAQLVPAADLLDFEADLYWIQLSGSYPDDAYGFPPVDHGDWTWTLVGAGADGDPVDLGPSAYPSWPTGTPVYPDSLGDWTHVHQTVAVVRPRFTHDAM